MGIKCRSVLFPPSLQPHQHPPTVIHRIQAAGRCLSFGTSLENPAILQDGDRPLSIPFYLQDSSCKTVLSFVNRHQTLANVALSIFFFRVRGSNLILLKKTPAFPIWRHSHWSLKSCQILAAIVKIPSFIQDTLPTPLQTRKKPALNYKLSQNTSLPFSLYLTMGRKKTNS